MAKVVLTREGLQKIEEELNNLKAKGRPEIAEKIKEAREFGDLSENSEYEAALNSQAMMEARISELEAMLKDYTLMDESEVDNNVVSVGSHVYVYDVEMEEEDDFTIVGKTESDPDEKKVSDQSPIGQALIGARVGTSVTVKAPDGDFIYEIRKIVRD